MKLDKDNERLLDEIADWLARGYTDEAHDRLRSLMSSRADDAEFQSRAAELLLRAPIAKKQGRPPKAWPTTEGGTIQLDKLPPMRWDGIAKTIVSQNASMETDGEIHAQVAALDGGIEQRIRAVAAERHVSFETIRAAYYRANKLK